jgi:hypothetical protein
MLPDSWPLVVGEDTKDQFDVVRRILTSPKISEVICATDAGREGELIFRYIYEAAGSDKPVKRLWISSLTHEAIREGFAKLRAWLRHKQRLASSRSRARNSGEQKLSSLREPSSLSFKLPSKGTQPCWSTADIPASRSFRTEPTW